MLNLKCWIMSVWIPSFDPATSIVKIIFPRIFIFYPGEIPYDVILKRISCMCSECTVLVNCPYCFSIMRTVDNFFFVFVPEYVALYTGNGHQFLTRIPKAQLKNECVVVISGDDKGPFVQQNVGISRLFRTGSRPKYTLSQHGSTASRSRAQPVANSAVSYTDARHRLGPHSRPRPRSWTQRRA